MNGMFRVIGVLFCFDVNGVENDVNKSKISYRKTMNKSSIAPMITYFEAM